MKTSLEKFVEQFKGKRLKSPFHARSSKKIWETEFHPSFAQYIQGQIIIHAEIKDSKLFLYFLIKDRVWEFQAPAFEQIEIEEVKP